MNRGTTLSRLQSRLTSSKSDLCSFKNFDQSDDVIMFDLFQNADFTFEQRHSRTPRLKNFMCNTALMNEWRASVAGVIDSGLIASLVKPVTFSLLDAQHKRNIMENKTKSLLVSLGKALSGIPPFWCG